MLQVFMIAGPNGAGKTTFSRQFLPNEANCINFINADLIAAGLSPFSPEKMAIPAARLMLTEIKRNLQDRQSFAIETTLSGLSYLQHIKHWQSIGYKVILYFLSVQSVEVSIHRVALRVSQGGHHIPEDVIRRRYISGLRNFEQFYKHSVNDWFFLDNTVSPPILLSRSHHD